MTFLDVSVFFIVEVDGCSAVTTKFRMQLLKEIPWPVQVLTMRGKMIHYVSVARVRRWTVFAVKLATICRVESVVEAGHCWGSG